MNLLDLCEKIKEFSKETHGSTNFDKDELFIMGDSQDQFAPLRYLCKQITKLESVNDLLRDGYIFDSYTLFEFPEFQPWYERQFSKKLSRQAAKKISVVHMPDNKSIFDAISSIDKGYEVLRNEQILLNSKNLPVQLGEWFAKCIFGLQQVKSTSQRGFDFKFEDKRTEIKVHWSDQSSPKGVKLKKSLLDLSEFCIIVYLAKNFTIREVCFLDSDFVMRKFATKGHTIFLKDSDIKMYFFSKSDKHQNKVRNSNALLKFSNPNFAMKIAERFSPGKKN